MSDLIDDPTPGQNMPEFTVSEVSGAIKRTLEDQFGRIRVRGEVGRVFKARSGHLYYDVKDDRNVLACTTWKGQISGLSVVPEEGLEVVVTGRLTAFGAQSKYNMNVDEVAVAGQGALMALLEKRKKTLEAEGLFDPAHKQKLPFLPQIIGVVTSPSGAVIRDILHRLRDRFPRKVLIWPVAVQGANCAPEVARAINGFNQLTPGGALPRPDLIIVARGGGSVEDLWGFNEEIVARAAAASQIPLISAVGHETDTTLIDYVSDQRAPTPTAAAELAVPVRLDLLAWTEEQGARLRRSASDAITRRGQRLADLSRALPRPETLLDTPRQRLDRAGERLEAALKQRLDQHKTTLARHSAGMRPAALNTLLARRQDQLSQTAARLHPALMRGTALRRQQLSSVANRLRPETLRRDLTQKQQQFSLLAKRTQDSAQRQLSDWRRALENTDRLRETLSYKATLKRGYAVVYDGDNVITTAQEAAKARDLQIEFQDKKIALSGKPSPTKTRKPTEQPPEKPEQGSLF